MRRTIRKRVRRQAEGVDLALDLNADIAVNVGRDDVRPTARAGVPEGERGAGDPAGRQATDRTGQANDEGKVP